MAKRELFVCPVGHVFRSCVKMKRIRQCTDCGAIVPDADRVKEGMKKARAIAEFRLSQLTPGQLRKSGLAFSEQVFKQGKIRRRKTSGRLLFPEAAA